MAARDRRLVCEALERRELLAGNITVELSSGGDLLVRGDESDNQVLVLQLDARWYAVVGWDTTVAGSEAPAILRVPGAITIELGDGADEVQLAGREDSPIPENWNLDPRQGELFIDLNTAGVFVQFAAPRALTVRAGEGNDSIRASLTARSRVSLHLGGGDDDLELHDSQIGQALDVRGGSGNDRMVIARTAMQQFSVDTGDGDTFLWARDLNVSRNVTIRGGADKDAIDMWDSVLGGDCRFVGGAGGDYLGVTPMVTDRMTIRGDLIIDGGDDYDIIDARLAIVGGDVQITSGAFDDDVYIMLRVAGSVRLDTGSGRDMVSLFRTEIGKSLSIATGAEPDEVGVLSCSIRGSFRAILGAGIDEIRTRSNPGDPFFFVGSDLIVDTGSEQDYVEVSDGAVAGSLRVTTGSGGDGVRLDNLEVRKNLDVSLGSGRNALAASHVQVGQNARLTGGQGRDEISLFALAVDRILTTRLGAGDDELQIFESAAQRADLQLGSGIDTVLWDYPTLPPNVVLKESELINPIPEEEAPEDVTVVPNLGSVTIITGVTVTSLPVFPAPEVFFVASS